MKDDEQETEEFEDLSTAKKREINALEDQIQSHTERSGEIAVSLAAKQNDLEDLEESLAEDGRVAREVLDAAGRMVDVGVTTDEIDRLVHEEAIKRGAYPSPLNYRGFPKSCCTSVTSPNGNGTRVEE